MDDMNLQQLWVVKVGGAVLEDKDTLACFLDNFEILPGLKILVHGGGRSATRLSEKLNIKSRMIEGRRITDADTLAVVTMVYGGQVNKQTVAALQKRGCNSIGLTGADLNLIRANKRAVTDIDYGFVGDITEVNSTALDLLLKNGITPVIAPLTHDGEGQLLNTNADSMASAIAIAMATVYSVSLIYCFEKAGVLSNPDDDTSVISIFTSASYRLLKEKGTIHSGMIPKIDNSFNALRKGVKEVIITNASGMNMNSGTHISL
jgi:acetylglutamate kinase